MKIYHGIETLQKLPNAVVTSGTFDGVHLGHKKILTRVKEIAKRIDGSTVLVTFWPHPRLVLYPEQQDLKLLNTFEEKALLLAAAGIEHLVCIPFTKEFSQLSSNEFIQKILVEGIGTKRLVIGYDHRFGKNREGQFTELKKNAFRYGFEVEEIPAQDVDEVTVSSTKIRHALAEGDIETSTELLGRPYALTGQVAHGNKLGSQIGFPTANLAVGFEHKLIPGQGVYAVTVAHEGNHYQGMLNIGTRPTVGGTTRTIEVNIFDFDKNIYDDSLTIYFKAFMRPEERYQSIKELTAQLVVDKKMAIDILNN